MKRQIIILSCLLFSLNSLLAQQQDSIKKPDTLKTYRLNEVTVKTARSPLQVKTDKIILQVESMPTATGLNAFDLLRQVPGVTIDGLDNIKISGKNGVQVLLDGKIQILNAQQLSSLLKGTMGDNLKSIEVMSNPSSKYDAAGNAGIINLVFKTSGNYGISGNLLAGYQKMQHYKQNNALNLNYRGKKLTSFVNGSLDNSLQLTEVSNKRILSSQVLAQNGTERQGYSNSTIRSGIDYTLNDRHKLAAVVNFQRTWDDFPSDASTISSGNINDLLLTSTLANLTENRLSTNLNYGYSGTKDGKFTLEADWMQYNSTLSNLVDNKFTNVNQELYFKNNTKSEINLFSVKADYIFKLGKTNLESGVKFSSSTTSNALMAEQMGSNIISIMQFNNFDYIEKISAAYVNAQHTYGKIELQMGLRAEHTNMRGLSTNEQGSITALPDTSYLNLFPALFLRYRINENNSLGFAYGRRVSRPSFQDQNPYLYRTDAYYASRGNPLLLPQFTQNLELDYSFGGGKQIKINYNTTKDLIETIRSQTGDQTLEIPVNAGKRSFLNVSLSTPFKFSKWWNGYFSAEPYYQFYKADLRAYNGLDRINQGGAGFNGYLSNNLELGNKWKAALSSWFNYASRSSIYSTKPIYSVDFSLKKSVLSDKLTLTMVVRDIFNTQKWEQATVLGNVNQTSLRKWESRGIYVGINYSFGNRKVRSPGTDKGKTEEQERIKSRS
ncbi:outer membrane beta-barrel protein [Pedobacter aquatilis]|uniref:outer membrane beta-barrel protein n=1 Tax=Pedobacter aquatilis TaxID=351343 RepID=UPI00292E8721|nr:outer membrane beta-barrel protein [Pedobacter aquatilis]